MEESGISRFPKPINNRIPNFEGSEKAAQKLKEQPEFQNAKVVKVNPDSPQIPVRKAVLTNGKLLIMPSPRLRSGLILLDPKHIPKTSLTKASTISGAFKYGKPLPLQEIPKVDLIVAGSVAVSRDGVRIGKGGGYSEKEYAILRELDLATEKTPIFTTIHDAQIIDKAPREEHDFVVDTIITPTKVIRVDRKYPQPKGMIWEKISKHELENTPILNELKNLKTKEPTKTEKTHKKFTGRTVTAIIEFPNNKILLIKRSTVPFKGYWALPGGRVEPGETVEQAVMREVKEETNLNIKIVRNIGEYHETGVQDGIAYDYHPACFLAKPNEGSIKRQETEIEEITLLDPENVPDKLAFEHSRMIKDYIAQRKATRDS
jgi:5-formyltetrahydrofolate cyclo-ligase